MRNCVRELTGVLAVHTLAGAGFAQSLTPALKGKAEAKVAQLKSWGTGAEESAAAALQLETQATLLRELVGRLNALVDESSGAKALR